MGLVISQRFGGPAFSAFASAGTSLVSGTLTKVAFATEEFDTDSNFASSRFTPTVAGYYQVNSCVAWTPAAGSSNWVSIFKNGAEYQRGPRTLESTNSLALEISSVVFCNGSTDYIEIFGFTNGGATTTAGDSLSSWFNGSMVRGL